MPAHQLVRGNPAKCNPCQCGSFVGTTSGFRYRNDVIMQFRYLDVLTKIALN